MAYSYIFNPDKHFGYENVGGHRKPLHNLKAMMALMAFAEDFKPQVWIEGGDDLDCGAISHWERHKRRRFENLRLVNDIEEYDRLWLRPVERSIKPQIKVKLTGNHEDWIDQFVDEHPEVEGLLDLQQRLQLQQRGWVVLPQGGVFKLGKLYFTHGDTIGGGEHVAKAAVIQYEKNIRFGHHHTYQTYTKHSPVDARETKTGVSVPCLCSRGPGYGKQKPNKWALGFNFGYVHDDGTFTDYTPIIVNGRFGWNGKLYRG